ncbi:MAG: hypothetical protein FJ275_08560, partial [Planctomycetes bacterium]|nr:hypothetical protein [Planctomycetota bacterium]
MVKLVFSYRRVRSRPAAAAILLAAMLVAWAASARAAEPPPADARAAETQFEQRVRPVLVARCQRCHGPGVAEAGLRLDSRQALDKGGDGGPVVVLGDVAASRLVAAIRRTGDLAAMPPDE